MTYLYSSWDKFRTLLALISELNSDFWISVPLQTHSSKCKCLWLYVRFSNPFIPQTVFCFGNQWLIRGKIGLTSKIWAGLLTRIICYGTFREIWTSDMEENGQIYVKMFQHWLNILGWIDRRLGGSGDRPKPFGVHKHSQR